MSMVIHVFKLALTITGFVGVMRLVIEYVNVLTQGAWQTHLAKNRWGQYVLAAFLGDKSFVMRALVPRQALLTLGMLFVLGILVGSLSDTIDRRWLPRPTRTDSFSLALGHDRPPVIRNSPGSQQTTWRAAVPSGRENVEDHEKAKKIGSAMPDGGLVP